MKITSVMLFGMLSAASLTASARLPAWFIAKHPDAKVMETMQAREARAAKKQHQMAANESHHARGGGETHGS